MNADEENAPLDPERQAALEKSFLNLPEDFDARRAVLRKLRDEFHDSIAVTFQASLQEQASDRDEKSDKGIVARKKTAAWIDNVTRELGVTIGSQKTGLPLLLIAETDFDGNAVYTLMGRRTPEQKIGRVHTSHELPKLHLIPAPDDLETMFQVYRPSREGGREP